MAVRELSFQRVSSIPSSGLATGSILFNANTHSIYIATSSTTAEQYGSDVKDVTWSGNVLTVTKWATDESGNNITYTLDFSDVASSTDVSKVCAGIVARVAAAEASVSSLQGSVSGHEQRIKDLENAMGGGEGGESLGQRVSDLETDVSGLKTTVGDANSGLVKDTNQLKIDVANKASKTGDSSQTFSVADPTDSKHAANKGYVDQKIAGVYKVQGSCTYTELLAKTNMANGDVWNVTTSNGKDSGATDYIPAGTNYVWIVDNTTTGAGHWDALGGTVDLSGYATSSELAGVRETANTAKERTDAGVVNTFGGQEGVITIKTANSADANGTVQFSMNGKQLRASVKGIADAAYKGVDTSQFQETSSSTNVPTTAAVAASISALHSAIQGEITGNSKMIWANEW